MAEEKDPLLAKLEELEGRYVELEKKIAEPAIASDSAKLIAVSKEQGKLKTVVAKYREYKKTVADIKNVEEMIKGPAADEDIKQLAEEELGELGGKKDTLLEEIRNILVMANDTGINSIIMEIRAGTGGEEAALRLAALSVALAFAALAASELLARRLRRRIGG